MRTGLNKLTVRGIESWVRSAKAGSRIGDGGGLYLVKGSGEGSAWSFLFTSPATGKRREMGLGSVSLAVARDLVGVAREQVERGIDPIEARRIEKVQGITFKEMSDEVLAVESRKWRHADREAVKWNRAVKELGALASMPVKGIGVADIVAALRAFDDRPTVKRYALTIVNRVLEAAEVEGLRIDNPATARKIGRRTSLHHKTTHNAAMPYTEVPAFVADLQTKDTVAARCLEFIILTGVRKSEATDATWDEIDGDVWRIPAERTKQGRPHDVPLTDRAMAILSELRGGDDFIFPGSKSGRRPANGKRPRSRPLSHGAFLHLLPAGITVHGFRSSLRDWLGNETATPFNVAEEVLGHRVGDMTTASYRRSSGLAKRREALTLWALHVLQQNVNQDKNQQTDQLVRDAA